MHRPAGLTVSNWLDAPFNRWGFWHVRQMARTARIARGNGPVLALPQHRVSFDQLRIPFRKDSVSWDAFLRDTYTDALVILHQGQLVHEWYVEGYGPSDMHLLMSCSKSLTACYFGVLVGRGLMDPQRMVVQYLPELKGTAWDGCRVRDVLDMRAGTRFDESNYDDPQSDGRLIEEVSGYRPRIHARLPKDTVAWIKQAENIREHGGMFEYRSLLTDVLAWMIEAVTGKPFAEGFAHDVWSQMGAEQDAEIIVDEAGFPVVEGGISATARDFARFGLMCLKNGQSGGQSGGQINGQIDGQSGGKQVLPADWLARLRKPDADLIAAYTASQGLDAAMPDSCYCDQWWVLDPTAGIYSAYGIHGQQLFIHHPTQTVVAKFSTWPTALSALELQDAGMFAICERLGGEG